MKRLHIALTFNGSTHHVPDIPEDRAGTSDLQRMIRLMARTLRRLGHTVTLLPLSHDLFAFQRKLRRLNPDVVFNQYEDFIPGASSDMRLVAVVRMMGYPVTGASPLALGLGHYKFTVASLLAGAGIPVPPDTTLVETLQAVDRRKWQFPLIVQPAQEHAGVGLDRNSVVYSKKDLRLKVREVLRSFHQPALVQHFLRGREFNVGLVGGRRMRVLPLAEVNYGELPPEIPPIMSYAAKWLETAVEYQKISITCPALVGSALESEIGQVALQAFRAVDGWGYGRVDIRLDEAGSPCVLDVNCNPCLDEGMSLARSAEKAGISYPQLLQLVVQAALEHPPFRVEEPIFTSLPRPRQVRMPAAAIP
jgi:D-alanine-D-alanine ligase